MRKWLISSVLTAIVAALGAVEGSHAANAKGAAMSEKGGA